MTNIRRPIDRDAAMDRLRRANRWLIAGSVALTGVFAEAAASAFPGRSNTKTAGRSAGSANRGEHSSNGSPSSSSEDQVKAPAQAPEAAQQSTQAESSTSSSAQAEQERARTQESEAATSSPSGESSTNGTNGSSASQAPTQESQATESSSSAESSSPTPAPEAPVVSGGS